MWPVLRQSSTDSSEWLGLWPLFRPLVTSPSGIVSCFIDMIEAFLHDGRHFSVTRLRFVSYLTTYSKPKILYSTKSGRHLVMTELRGLTWQGWSPPAVSGRPLALLVSGVIEVKDNDVSTGGRFIRDPIYEGSLPYPPRGVCNRWLYMTGTLGWPVYSNHFVRAV